VSGSNRVGSTLAREYSTRVEVAGSGVALAHNAVVNTSAVTVF
jgi:hypothetical protein